jgi:hypothetical protein
MWRVWGSTEVHTGVWWGNLKEREHLIELDEDGKVILSGTYENCLRERRGGGG